MNLAIDTLNYIKNTHEKAYRYNWNSQTIFKPQIQKRPDNQTFSLLVY